MNNSITLKTLNFVSTKDHICNKVYLLSACVMRPQLTKRLLQTVNLLHTDQSSILVVLQFETALRKESNRLHHK
jgi:hypothetical protein